ncbi:MAG: hypothetical protein KA788_02865 [Lacunisphaera sp.]|jgi:hypothetical protein|nr:hypothetical protein [Lacunisphaera sp.]
MSLPENPRSLSGPMHGIWRLIPSPCVSELLAQAGLDLQILDREHGGCDRTSLATDIMACEAHRCAPLVHVGGANAVEIPRGLNPAVRSLGYGGGPPPQPALPWFVLIIETLTTVEHLGDIL